MTNNTTTFKTNATAINTNVTKPTTATTTAIFSVADLWHIQRQVKTAFARRRSM